MVRAPTLPMQVVIAPTRFWLPSSTSAGPNRICFREPVAPTLIRVPRGRFACGVADNDRNPHFPAEFFKIERLIFRGDMADGGDGALNDKNIGSCFLRDRAEFRGTLRNRAYRRGCSAIFDLPDTGGDQIFLNGL